MTSMIEKVAKAIEDNIAIGRDGADYDCRDAARAAIEAMREPTFAPENVPYLFSMTRADWWGAMIDAALNQHEAETPK